MKSRKGKNNPAYTHGYRRRGIKESSIYMSWYSMNRRCYNKKGKNYNYYGGRGIKVFPLWRYSFIEFLKYMGKKPKGKTLDRIDVNKGYFPGNVRWSTRKEQTRNRRKEFMGKDYIVNGEKLKAFEVQEKYKIKRSTFYARIRYGLPIVKNMS